MIIIYPNPERATVISIDQFKNQLIEAYANHKDNVRIKKLNSRVSKEDIDFVISYWVSELPSKFTSALDNDASYISYDHRTYPQYFDKQDLFLKKLFIKAFPLFRNILCEMNIKIDVISLKEDNPFVKIDLAELTQFINNFDEEMIED